MSTYCRATVLFCAMLAACIKESKIHSCVGSAFLMMDGMCAQDAFQVSALRTVVCSDPLMKKNVVH